MSSLQPDSGPALVATARLRQEILSVGDLGSLVALFAAALSEHGIEGHFCLVARGDAWAPLAGDRAELIARQNDCVAVDCEQPRTRVLLAGSGAANALVRGYAQLYAARAVALHEHQGDVATDCGLTLRERYVLGRRLAGLAPVDIALESGLTVALVGALNDSGLARLGGACAADAISIAARRGWLAVTSLENCCSSSRIVTYKAVQNG
jgi:hypothetical protein